MFGKTKLDESVTLIAAGTEVVGDLRFGHQLYVSGRVEGDIVSAEGSEATLIVGQTGVVRGDVRVANVMVSGRIEGNVYATGRVELSARAQVRGNVHYRLMEMQSGAMVEGQLLHHEGATDRSDSFAAGATPAAAPSLKSINTAGRGPA